MATGEGTKYVRIALSKGEHHTLRLAAAHRDLDMATFTKTAALRVAGEELKRLASSMGGQENTAYVDGHPYGIKVFGEDGVGNAQAKASRPLAKFLVANTFPTADADSPNGDGGTDADGLFEYCLMTFSNCCKAASYMSR